MSKKQKTSTSEDIEIPELPLVLTFKIIQNKDCKFIIRTLSESKRQIKRLEITKSQFESLTDKIDSEAFDKLKRKAADHVQDEGTYSLKKWPHIEKFVEDPEIQQAANKFYTKCLFKYLYDTYEGDTMKKKWYDAIKQENKLDLKNFRYFTDTTSIGDRAFFNNQLTSVSIPDSVTSIGIAAFANNQLRNVMIPDSVTSIGSSAFESNQLTSVRISASVTKIRNWAFQHNQLTSVSIPDSVTSIGDRAFEDNSLTSVTFGAASNVRRIGRWAFANNKLRNVMIPASVTEYADAFDPNVTIIREGDVAGTSATTNLLQLKF